MKWKEKSKVSKMLESSTSINVWMPYGLCQQQCGECLRCWKLIATSLVIKMECFSFSPSLFSLERTLHTFHRLPATGSSIVSFSHPIFNLFTEKLRKKQAEERTSRKKRGKQIGKKCSNDDGHWKCEHQVLQIGETKAHRMSILIRLTNGWLASFGTQNLKPF